jgi:Domain found in IF2B/IF5
METSVSLFVSNMGKIFWKGFFGILDSKTIFPLSLLTLGGRYLPKYIESLLRKYVLEYVTCQMCRSPNTELVKDQGSRLYFCNCQDCGSRRSVAPIKAGYHATNRADRRAARNNT